MKFLIFGAAGMAGNTVSRYLLSKGHEVKGVSREAQEGIDTAVCDVNDLDSVATIFKEGSYDYIVNCIGILNQFAEANHDQAVFLNAYFPQFLAALTKNTKTNCIFLSTDCVFSGKRGEYTEADFPDDTTFYGRSKALGEVIDDKNLTIRTSIVGPDTNAKGIGLLNWFMSQNGSIKGYRNAIWTGITTVELAKIIEKVAQANATGLINMVNNEPISKLNLLGLFNEIFMDNQLQIEAFDDYYSNKSLVRTKFDFDYTVPSYKIMIAEMKDWMITNKNLYPHYNI